MSPSDPNGSCSVPLHRSLWGAVEKVAVDSFLAPPPTGQGQLHGAFTPLPFCEVSPGLWGQALEKPERLRVRDAAVSPLAHSTVFTGPGGLSAVGTPRGALAESAQPETEASGQGQGRRELWPRAPGVASKGVQFNPALVPLRVHAVPCTFVYCTCRVSEQDTFHSSGLPPERQRRKPSSSRRRSCVYKNVQQGRPLGSPAP